MEDPLENGAGSESQLGINRTERLFWDLPKILNKNPERFWEYQDLLIESVKMHYSLGLPIVYRDSDGGEHYAHELTEEELNSLRSMGETYDFEVPDSMAIEREERPWGRGYYDEYGHVRDNPWGDLIMTFRLESDNVQKTYTFTIFLESGAEIYLNKYTEFTNDEDGKHSVLGSIVGDMIGHNNPDENATSINDIDQMELNSLVKLIKNVKEVIYGDISSDKLYKEYDTRVNKLRLTPYEGITNEDTRNHGELEYAFRSLNHNKLIAEMEHDLKEYVTDLMIKKEEADYTNPDRYRYTVELLRIFDAQVMLSTANNYASEVHKTNATKWHEDGLMEDAQRTKGS